MPNFGADIVEATTYDFEAWGQEGVKGTIPEPTSRQLEDFLAALKEILPYTQDANGEAQFDLTPVIEKAEGGLDIEQFLNGAIADLCSNQPTAEQITALPARVKSAWYGFIFGTYILPEA